MQCFAAPSLTALSLLPAPHSPVRVRLTHLFVGWAPLKAMAEVSEGECLTATFLSTQEMHSHFLMTLFEEGGEHFFKYHIVVLSR